MKLHAVRIFPDDLQNVIPVLRESHSFSTNDETRSAFLTELQTGHEYRGVKYRDELCALMSWQQRGLPYHGVAEIFRFSMPEQKFDPSVAELLFDTVIAAIDYRFKQQHSGLRKVYSIISANRTKARMFLEEKGFIEEGRLHNHYHQGRDERVYSLFFNAKSRLGIS